MLYKVRSKKIIEDALALFDWGFSTTAAAGLARLTFNTLPLSSFISILSIASSASAVEEKVTNPNPRCFGSRSKESSQNLFHSAFQAETSGKRQFKNWPFGFGFWWCCVAGGGNCTSIISPVKKGRSIHMKCAPKWRWIRHAKSRECLVKYCFVCVVTNASNEDGFLMFRAFFHAWTRQRLNGICHVWHVPLTVSTLYWITVLA